MWTKEINGRWIICNSFSYHCPENGHTNVTLESDKRRNYGGFVWEGDKSELERLEAINAALDVAQGEVQPNGNN